MFEMKREREREGKRELMDVRLSLDLEGESFESSLLVARMERKK